VGFLKGSLDDKLAPYAQIICDHIGGKIGLEIMIQNGKIELQHLGFMRGRNIEDSIIYCSEAENMTKEHVQLLMGRVGSGSFLFLNGDMKQTDEAVFENNNGLGKMIETLKGHQKFAHVKLLKTERSETAAMADLLD
jgi:PhoH-like ATPase